MAIRQDAAQVLTALATYEQFPGDPERGRYVLNGPELQQLTGLAPQRINDAIELLEDGAYVEVHRTMGTTPFVFAHVELTARGRLEAEHALTAPSEPDKAIPGGSLPQTIYPVGSPYGFTEHDWASVDVDRKDPGRLIVSLAMQWQSAHYNSPTLETNVRAMFEHALTEVAHRTRVPVRLDFRKLQGGYGGHLFNEIARDIIASHIAVFETSDLNPNVMIELGVALTWGVSVLPIRDEAAPKPPTDVSGQTWAEYRRSCAEWLDPNHEAKLTRMVEFSLRRKGSI